MKRFLHALGLVLLVASAAAAEEEAGPASRVTEVSIPRAVGRGEDAASFAIAGSLRTPTAARPASGFPAVLFISGSGPQTREGRQAGLDLGTGEILDAIARAGFVVLSTDDRGAGKTPIGPEGTDPSTVGYDALVGDARTCLAWLRAHQATDPARTFLVGHSEGGLTAPILAGEGGVAGVVFLAAMGRNMRDTVRGQVEDALAQAPEAVRAGQLAIQDELMGAVAEAREPDFEALPEALRGQARVAWGRVLPIRTYWREHFRIDVDAVHRALACPCLVAQGACDFQVTVDRDAKRIVRNLLAGPAKDITFRVYDDLDHLFKPCGGRKSSIAMYAETRAVSRVFLADLVAWLSTRAR